MADEIISKGIQAGYNVELAKKYGVIVAIVLNRLVFLHKNTPREDKFTWQTAKDWEEHTGLSDYQVKSALDKLASLGIIELKNTYIIGTQIKCRHQRFILKSDFQETSKSGIEETSKSETQETPKSVNSIEPSKEHSIEHKEREKKEDGYHIVKMEKPVSEHSLSLASLLKEKILEIYPNNVGAKKTDCVNRWAKDIDKMIRIDNRNISDIEKAILWAMNDSFWQRNIWSGANLRKYYDRLEADARAKFMKNGQIVL